MDPAKLTDSTHLIRVAQLHQPYGISTEPGTFNIYLFECMSPQSEACLHIHQPAGSENSSYFPALQGYHVSLREELIFMLGCDHIVPFNLYETDRNHLILIIAPVLFVKLAAIIQKIPPAFNKDNFAHMTRLLSLVKLLIVHVSRHHRKFQDLAVKGRPYNEDLTRKFINLINLEIHHRRSVCEYARLLCVNRGILDQALQSTTGYTANRLIQRTLVYKAKQAAIHSNVSMKETAYNLGFSDIAHFSKFFRQKAGMTFSTFKQTFQNV